MLQSAPGTYILWLQLDSGCRLQIGKLGCFRFSPGVYGYVGSAFGPGGLRSRLGRHFRREKTSHWHIDYLRESAAPLGAWLSYDEQGHEHDWARALTGVRGARIGVQHFGSSGCHCASHLVHFSRLPDLGGFRNRVAACTRSLEWVEAAEL